MTQSLPAVLLNGNNAEVLHYLEPLSCHADNIESLRSYLSLYPDVHQLSPNAGNYRYFLWYTGDTVFAYGVGMSDVCLRVADAETALAAEYARASWRFDGASWFSFRYDYEQLEDLARPAYNHAKSRINI